MDKLSAKERSRNMGKIRSKDTSPEITIRKLIHSLGYRFRLHRKDLPGKPDLVFPSRKKIIFIHGCFWHQHQDPSCKIARIPKSKTEYWLPKLQRNSERDIVQIRALTELGWDVLVIWECETKLKEELTNKITEFLQGE